MKNITLPKNAGHAVFNKNPSHFFLRKKAKTVQLSESFPNLVKAYSNFSFMLIFAKKKKN